MAPSHLRYEYKLCRSEYIIEEKRHIGYGISVIDKCCGKEIMCVKDITVSRVKMMKLIKTCNKLHLSPTHIYDVVNDFLG